MGGGNSKKTVVNNNNLSYRVAGSTFIQTKSGFSGYSSQDSQKARGSQVRAKADVTTDMSKKL